MTWNTVVGIVEPPGEPTIIKRVPSFSTIVGVIELSILLPGSTELASPPISPYIFGNPGLTEKSSISLFNRNPAPFTTILFPNEPLRVVVTETAFPSLSTTE